MRRTLTVMAMVIALALSTMSTAFAAPDGKDSARCFRELGQLVGFKNLDKSATYIGGTDGNDDFNITGADEVYCGFGGNDSVLINHGTFYGGANVDRVFLNYGTFYGGAGDDYVLIDIGGTFVD